MPVYACRLKGFLYISDLWTFFKQNMIICYYFRYYWIPLLVSTLLPICILSTSNTLWHCLTVNVPLACFFLYCVQKVWGYCRASTWKVLQQEFYLFPLIIFSSLVSVLLYCLKTEISLGKCKGKVSRNNLFLLISHTIGMAVAWLQGRAKKMPGWLQLPDRLWISVWTNSERFCG